MNSWIEASKGYFSDEKDEALAGDASTKPQLVRGKQTKSVPETKAKSSEDQPNESNASAPVTEKVAADESKTTNQRDLESEELRRQALASIHRRDDHPPIPKSEPPPQEAMETSDSKAAESPVKPEKHLKPLSKSKDWYDRPLSAVSTETGAKPSQPLPFQDRQPKRRPYRDEYQDREEPQRRKWRAAPYQNQFRKLSPFSSQMLQDRPISRGVSEVVQGKERELQAELDRLMAGAPRTKRSAPSSFHLRPLSLGTELESTFCDSPMVKRTYLQTLKDWTSVKPLDQIMQGKMGHVKDVDLEIPVQPETDCIVKECQEKFEAEVYGMIHGAPRQTDQRGLYPVPGCSTEDTVGQVFRQVTNYMEFLASKAFTKPQPDRGQTGDTGLSFRSQAPTGSDRPAPAYPHRDGRNWDKPFAYDRETDSYREHADNRRPGWEDDRYFGPRNDGRPWRGRDSGYNNYRPGNGMRRAPVHRINAGPKNGDAPSKDVLAGPLIDTSAASPIEEGAKQDSPGEAATSDSGKKDSLGQCPDIDTEKSPEKVKTPDAKETEKASDIAESETSNLDRSALYDPMEPTAGDDIDAGTAELSHSEPEVKKRKVEGGKKKKEKKKEVDKKAKKEKKEKKKEKKDKKEKKNRDQRDSEIDEELSHKRKEKKQKGEQKEEGKKESSHSRKKKDKQERSYSDDYDSDHDSLRSPRKEKKAEEKLQEEREGNARKRSRDRKSKRDTSKDRGRLSSPETKRKDSESRGTGDSRHRRDRSVSGDRPKAHHVETGLKGTEVSPSAEKKELPLYGSSGGSTALDQQTSGSPQSTLPLPQSKTKIVAEPVQEETKPKEGNKEQATVSTADGHTTGTQDLPGNMAEKTNEACSRETAAPEEIPDVPRMSGVLLHYFQDVNKEMIEQILGLGADACHLNWASLETENVFLWSKVLGVHTKQLETKGDTSPSCQESNPDVPTEGPDGIAVNEYGSVVSGDASKGEEGKAQDKESISENKEKSSAIDACIADFMGNVAPETAPEEPRKSLEPAPESKGPKKKSNSRLMQAFRQQLKMKQSTVEIPSSKPVVSKLTAQQAAKKPHPKKSAKMLFIPPTFNQSEGTALSRQTWNLFADRARAIDSELWDSVCKESIQEFAQQGCTALVDHCGSTAMDALSRKVYPQMNEEVNELLNVHSITEIVRSIYTRNKDIEVPSFSGRFSLSNLSKGSKTESGESLSMKTNLDQEVGAQETGSQEIDSGPKSSENQTRDRSLQKQASSGHGKSPPEGAQRGTDVPPGDQNAKHKTIEKTDVQMIGLPEPVAQMESRSSGDQGKNAQSHSELESGSAEGKENEPKCLSQDNIERTDGELEGNKKTDDEKNEVKERGKKEEQEKNQDRGSKDRKERSNHEEGKHKREKSDRTKSSSKEHQSRKESEKKKDREEHRGSEKHREKKEGKDSKRGKSKEKKLVEFEDKGEKKRLDKGSAVTSKEEDKRLRQKGLDVTRASDLEDGEIEDSRSKATDDSSKRSSELESPAKTKKQKSTLQQQTSSKLSFDVVEPEIKPEDADLDHQSEDSSITKADMPTHDVDFEESSTRDALSRLRRLTKPILNPATQYIDKIVLEQAAKADVAKQELALRKEESAAAVETVPDVEVPKPPQESSGNEDVNTSAEPVYGPATLDASLSNFDKEKVSSVKDSAASEAAVQEPSVKADDVQPDAKETVGVVPEKPKLGSERPKWDEKVPLPVTSTEAATPVTNTPPATGDEKAKKPGQKGSRLLMAFRQELAAKKKVPKEDSGKSGPSISAVEVLHKFGIKPKTKGFGERTSFTVNTNKPSDSQAASAGSGATSGTTQQTTTVVASTTENKESVSNTTTTATYLPSPEAVQSAVRALSSAVMELTKTTTTSSSSTTGTESTTPAGASAVSGVTSNPVIAAAPIIAAKPVLTSVAAASSATISRPAVIAAPVTGAAPMPPATTSQQSVHNIPRPTPGVGLLPTPPGGGLLPTPTADNTALTNPPTHSKGGPYPPTTAYNSQQSSYPQTSQDYYAHYGQYNQGNPYYDSSQSQYSQYAGMQYPGGDQSRNPNQYYGSDPYAAWHNYQTGGYPQTTESYQYGSQYPATSASQGGQHYPDQGNSTSTADPGGIPLPQPPLPSDPAKDDSPQPPPPLPPEDNSKTEADNKASSTPDVSSMYDERYVEQYQQQVQQFLKQKEAATKRPNPPAQRAGQPAQPAQPPDYQDYNSWYSGYYGYNNEGQQGYGWDYQNQWGQWGDGGNQKSWNAPEQKGNWSGSRTEKRDPEVDDRPPGTQPDTPGRNRLPPPRPPPPRPRLEHPPPQQQQQQDHSDQRDSRSGSWTDPNQQAWNQWNLWLQWQQKGGPSAGLPPPPRFGPRSPARPPTPRQLRPRLPLPPPDQWNSPGSATSSGSEAKPTTEPARTYPVPSGIVTNVPPKAVSLDAKDMRIYVFNQDSTVCKSIEVRGSRKVDE